jgi:hypothetical protein
MIKEKEMRSRGRGNHTTKQRTFSVDGKKITIKSTNRTINGNPNGFYVYINGERFYSNRLERNIAEDNCYAQWVKKQ